MVTGHRDAVQGSPSKCEHAARIPPENALNQYLYLRWQIIGLSPPNSITAPTSPRFRSMANLARQRQYPDSDSAFRCPARSYILPLACGACEFGKSDHFLSRGAAEIQAKHRGQTDRQSSDRFVSRSLVSDEHSMAQLLFDVMMKELGPKYA